MSSRRRALLVLVAALVLAAAAWVASFLIGHTRLDFERAGDGGSLAVRTDLPLATCSKEFTGEFPWVRLGCEGREDAEATGRASTSEAGSESLDTTGTAE